MSDIRTNARLVNLAWSFSAAGYCGFSSLIASVTLSSPGGMGPLNGRHVIIVEQQTANAPIHLEARSVFTNISSVETEVEFIQYLASNSQDYGGSAVQPQGKLLLASGQNIAIALEAFVGSAMRVYAFAASNTASATLHSGNISIWRV